MDSSPGPSVVTRAYKAYFTDAELAALSDKQRGKLSSARVERGRQTACSFIEAVCERVGFPRRTTATAQLLYHRFHLYFPLKDFSHTEVSLACIYVSSKLHDTLKKPRDLILHSYAIRYPLLLAGRLNVDPQTVDQKTLEGDKRKVASLERLVLETICFNLGVGRPDVAALGVKVGRALGLSQDFLKLSWRMTADVYRTIAPLQHTPSSLILGSIYTVSLLTLTPLPASLVTHNDSRSTNEKQTEMSEEEQQTRIRSMITVEAERIRGYFSIGGEWEGTFANSVGEVDSVAHHLLDMHITLLTVPLADPSSSTTFSPESPNEWPLTGSGAQVPPALPWTTPNGNKDKNNDVGKTAFRISPSWTSNTLTQLKISLRESAPKTIAAMPGVRLDPTLDGIPATALEDGERGKDIAKGRNGAEVWGALSEGLGKNDATIRFLFE